MQVTTMELRPLGDLTMATKYQLPTQLGRHLAAQAKRML